MRSKLAKQRRTTWIPNTEVGDGPLAGSKFAGTCVVPAGEDWPRCPNCGRPMQLFVQLAAADLPTAAPGFGDGVLQLFYCTTRAPMCEVQCEAYAPFAASVLARVVDPGTGVAPATAPDHPPPPRRIVGWTAVDDYPCWEELESSGITLDDAEIEELGETYPRPGDKLWGWPAWVQSVEYPACSKCGRAMRYLLQIDSEDNLPYMFGDAGTGHLSQCHEHPEVMSFHWACT
ncbi:DUF1963 domain-containing protein [Haliangium sp.]|uniref:DUF1963 domain-containing protein n=1 Tax=Haliangium sp. TaxID=2663208 RepID=UPI003D14669C